MNRIILLILLLYIKSAQSASCKGPVREGGSTTITKTVSSLENDEIVWKIQTADGSNNIVTRCNPDDNPVCKSPFPGYSSTMTRDGSKYRVTLTINSARRSTHQTTFTWFDGPKIKLGECDLPVYSIGSPSCNTLQISSSGDYVTWQCTVVKVYPKIECQFKYRKGSSGVFGDVLQSEYVTSSNTSSGDPPHKNYYNYVCTMNLPIGQLSAGSYQFEMRGAMDYSGYIMYRGTKTQSIRTEYPVAEFIECPSADEATQGYIQAGTTRTCGCRLKKVGIPLGVPQWKNARNQLVGGTVVDGVTTLNLIYNANDPSPSYTCGGHSAIGDGVRIPFNPKFASSCKGPVREGGSTTITKTVSSLENDEIVWKIQTADGSNNIVTSCNPDDNPACTSPFPGYSSTMTRDGSKYRVTLTINNVRRSTHQTTFTWFDGPKIKLGECDLPVYSLPSDSSCNTLQISSSGDHVTWQCTVVKVYPKIECQFRYKKDSRGVFGDVLQSEYVTSSNTYSGDPPHKNYYNYVCTMNLPIGQLSAGSYQFKMEGAIGYSGYIMYRGAQTQSIRTEYPVAEFIECPSADEATQGYIQAGTTRTCGCRLKKVGIPLGVPQWKNARNQLVGGTAVDGVTTLNLIYNANDHSPSYTCGGHSAIGDGVRIPFNPKFAYTPTIPYYKVNSKTKDLVISNKDTVTLLCDAEGNPKPDVTVRGQRSKEYVTLDHSPFGSFGKRNAGKKQMFCKDTDTYTCMADNGIGRVEKSVNVSVECTPELPSGLDQTNKEFSPTNGTDLEIRVQIISYPEPKDFSLKKVDTKGRSKRRSTTELTSDQYNATYTSGHPPEGTVMLWIFDLFSGDSGQYVLTIDNGIGKLDYEFNVSIVAANKEDDDSSGLGTSAVVGIGLAVGLTLCVLFVIVGIKVKRKRRQHKKEDRTIRTHTMAMEQGHDNPTVD